VRGHELIDPLEDARWADLVATSPTAEIFHDPLWLALLRDEYGYELSASCVVADGRIEAALPFARIKSRLTGNRLVALPFSDTCGPRLAADAGLEALGELGEAAAAQAATEGLDLTVHSAMPSLGSGGTVAERFVRHEMQLPADPDEAEKMISKSLRQGARKARREGLEIERRSDRGGLEAFYGLHLETRRRLGVPTQPKSFINRFESLFDAGLGSVCLVVDAGEPIAAAVFLTHRDTVTYKYGASAASALKKRPNNLLFTEAIRDSAERGFAKFDFGRTDLDNEGLRKFKCRLGGEELPLSYTYLGEADPAPAGAPSLRERAMTRTIQRSPAVVGRLAGQVLYRHVG